MKITSKSAEELAAEGHPTPGIHPFLIATPEKASASGLPMFELWLEIPNAEGRVIGELRDWLTEQSGARLRQCAEVCVLLAQYESGELDAHEFVWKSGRCRVVIKRSKQYGEQARLADYLSGAMSITTRARPVLPASSELRREGTGS